MGYIIATPQQFTARSLPPRRLSGLGVMPEYAIYRNGGGGGIYPYRRAPLPVAPKMALPPTPIAPAPAPAVAAAQPPSGYCVVTSSPETGGITSVVPCASGQGGVPVPGSAAVPAISYTSTPTPSVTSPVPSTQPLNQPYTDSYGNIWSYGASGWQISGNVSSALPVNQPYGGYGAASPVPANYPTSLPYTDTQGNTWTYGASGWQMSSYGPAGAAGAASYTGGTTSITTGSSYQSILDWLSQQTLISGIPNWGIVAAAGAGVLLLKNRGNGGRR